MILQYADDMILFLENDLEQAKNLKIVLYTFEKVSDLKINSIRASFSALVKLRLWPRPILNYLGVRKGLCPSNT
jgi:hypothetical protein